MAGDDSNGNGTQGDGDRREDVWANVDWPPVQAKLVAFARLRGCSDERAREVAQRAITRGLDGHYAPWDGHPAGDPYPHLRRIAAQILRQARQGPEARFECLDQAEAIEVAASKESGPESEIGRRERRAKIVSHVQSRLKRASILAIVAPCWLISGLGVEDTASATGLSRSQVVTAHERLRVLVEQAIDEVDDDDDDDDEAEGAAGDAGGTQAQCRGGGPSKKS